MAVNITIPISDALAARLQVKYGNLANLRDTTRIFWRTEVLEEDLHAFKKALVEAQLANVQAQVQAERTRLENEYA